MKKKNVIYNLIIANLSVLLLLLLKRITILKEFINVLLVVIIAPVLFGVFFFYILRPLDSLFLRKGMKKSRAASLTLIIAAFLLAGIFRYFGTYLFTQGVQLIAFINTKFTDESTMRVIDGYMMNESFKGLIQNISDQVISYITVIISNSKDIFDAGMMIFSDLLLVILIIFFLLKDGEKVKPTILKSLPSKYKKISGEILSKSDDVLSTYVIGQAIVALSLASMVFIGYKIIKMPSAVLLSSITFILAFIPFIGFFISMIIPYMIAIILGPQMILRLSILVLIAQTLKGRVVVPFIMGRAMKIHPITDIFLVVGAASIGGALMAFCIVPIYSILKLILQVLIEQKEIPWYSNIKSMNNRN